MEYASTATRTCTFTWKNFDIYNLHEEEDYQVVLSVHLYEKWTLPMQETQASA